MRKCAICDQVITITCDKLTDIQVYTVLLFCCFPYNAQTYCFLEKFIRNTYFESYNKVCDKTGNPFFPTLF